jgi:serine/threonine-protein kinase
VHRDIKPANVMLSPTGAKVVDFGIAAAMSSGPAAADSPAAPESPFGGPAISGRPAAFLSSAASVAPLEDELLGTPAYLAPERLASDQVVPASDVYALGVVLYRLFSGRTPWNAENTRQMLEAHIYVEPAPLPPVPGVPDTVAELCDRCLAKDPAARPTAQEAAAVLARGAGLRVVADEPRPGPDGGFVGEEATVLVRPKPPAARPAGRRRAVLWTTAAAVLTLAAAGGWALLDRPGAELSTAERPTAAASASPGASGSVAPKPGVAPTGSGGKAALPARSRPAAAATGRTTGPAPTGRVTSPAATGPATTSPTTTPATTPPPADAEPVRFTSTGGSIEATCPSSTTAEILSWDPASPYKVQSSDPGPGRSPTVVFKHGNRLVTMTVTCSGGVPALA